MPQAWVDVCMRWGLELSARQVGQLEQYVHLLHTWCRVINLTSVCDLEGIWLRHVVDSLSVVPYVQAGERCLDVGTGAGLPGIPLAIWFQDRQWVLLDKNRKKTAFLLQVLGECNLSHVEVITHDVNTVVLDPCDGIFTRAYGALSSWVGQTLRLMAPGGTWYALQGSAPHEACDAVMQTYRDLQIEISELHVPSLHHRHLVQINQRACSGGERPAVNPSMEA